jgi:hypothetical protein
MTDEYTVFMFIVDNIYNDIIYNDIINAEISITDKKTVQYIAKTIDNKYINYNKMSINRQTKILNTKSFIEYIKQNQYIFTNKTDEDNWFIETFMKFDQIISEYKE